MKTMRLMALVLACLFIAATPALAASGDNPGTYVLVGAGLGAGIGAALTIVGAGLGFGKIGSSALESMARQPEKAGQIQVAMIIIGALLEGATFFALLVCIQLVEKVNAGL